MKTWKKVTLREVADIIPGYAFKGEDFCITGAPVIKIKDINPPSVLYNTLERVDLSRYKNKNIEKYTAAKNDFVIAMTGATIGKVGKIRFSDIVYINQRVAKIRPKDAVCWDFIYYCAISNLFYQHIINNIDSNSAQENISATSIGSFSFYLPPLPEQKTIAAVLGSLDDKIDLLQRQNVTLEAMAETIFRQYFIDGMQERWRRCKLSDVLELNYGKALKEKDRSGVGFPVVGSNGIIGYHDTYLIKGPGIVIGRKGTIGKTLFIYENFYPIDTTYYITPKKDYYNVYYIYFLLKFINFSDLNTDSAVPGLNRTTALSIEVYDHPEYLIDKFCLLVYNFFSKIHANQKQIRTLEKLRDTLLPKLMSGEVRVRVDG